MNEIVLETGSVVSATMPPESPPKMNSMVSATLPPESSPEMEESTDEEGVLDADSFADLQFLLLEKRELNSKICILDTTVREKQGMIKKAVKTYEAEIAELVQQREYLVQGVRDVDARISENPTVQTIQASIAPLNFERIRIASEPEPAKSAPNPVKPAKKLVQDKPDLKAPEFPVTRKFMSLCGKKCWGQDGTEKNCGAPSKKICRHKRCWRHCDHTKSDHKKCI